MIDYSWLLLFLVSQERVIITVSFFKVHFGKVVQKSDSCVVTASPDTLTYQKQSKLDGNQFQKSRPEKDFAIKEAISVCGLASSCQFPLQFQLHELFPIKPIALHRKHKQIHGVLYHNCLCSPRFLCLDVQTSFAKVLILE